jgi:hypothetical protein
MMKTSPFEAQPPARKRLLRSVALALAGALVILVTFVLPAEYSVDPTGAGGLLGLTALSEPTRTLQIKDVTGGNERYREFKVPEAGDPIPLPNPGVFQGKSTPPRAASKTIRLQSGEATEVKVRLEVGQVTLYAWHITGGDVYTDFHGHESNAADDVFVRYEEQQSGKQGNGSLVAPFTGEHGWYWLNISEGPVDVVLNVSGYYQDLVDYGVFNN